MKKVYAIGEALIDFLSTKQDTYKAQIGGAPANVAAMVSIFKGQSAFIGAVGHDYFGSMIVNQLKEIDVETTYLKQINQSTMLAFVHLDQRGNRSFTFYHEQTSDLCLETSMIQPIIFNHDILHFCSVALLNENNRQTHDDAITSIKQTNGIVSFDPNMRLSIWKGMEDTLIKTIRTYMKKADLIKLSEEELEAITGIKDEQQAIRSLKLLPQQRLIISKAERGASIYLGSNRIDAKPSIVQAIDTTGAGDALIGYILLKIQQSQVDFADLDAVQWQTILNEAVDIASKTTCYHGAIPAYQSVYQQIIK